MGDLTNLILTGTVEFPSSISGAPWPLNWFPFIGHFVYAIISGMYGGGVVSYGVAIIFFTIILKLILLPLDFLNKYFTKRNARFMKKIKPEEDTLKEQYASDPMQLHRARQELYRKHGYKMSGFCIFMFINLFVTMAIFFSVFGALRFVADYNVGLQVHAVQGVYQEFSANDNDFAPINGVTFEEAINTAYSEHAVGFLWIRNIWKEDVPWTNATLTSGQFLRHVLRDAEFIPEDELILINAERIQEGLPTTSRAAIAHAQFEIIYNSLDSTHKRNWNGLLILIVLAGITSWASAYLTSKMMNKSKPTDPTTPKEQKVEYSMRNTKNQSDQSKIPTVDPVVMGRIMKIILPIVMVYFTMISTAALAIYIIMNSIITTALVAGLSYPVDKLLDWQEKRKMARGDTPPETEAGVINPHAKYFKNKRKK